MSEENQKSEFIKIFGAILPSIPLLVLRFLKMYLGFKKQANKSGKIFKKELIKQGLDKETAQKITDVYMQPSKIKNYVTRIKK